MVEVFVHSTKFLYGEAHALSGKQLIATAVQYKERTVWSRQAGNIGVVQIDVDDVGIEDISMAFVG